MTLMRYTRPENKMNKRFSDIMDEFFNDAINANRFQILVTTLLDDHRRVVYFFFAYPGHHPSTL